MTNEAVAAILARSPNVLLDFDGPVCSVFGNLSDHTVADRLKALLGDGLPPAIEATDDPFKVLHYSDTVDSSTVRSVERLLRQLEVEAVTSAPATPDAAAAMESLVKAGHTLSIVSNNSAEAVDVYLSLHDLGRLVSNISARARPEPGLLKPGPHLLNQAIESLGVRPDQCVMVGDSASDIEAARRAGTAIIAFANKSMKRERFELHRADAIIDHMNVFLHVDSGGRDDVTSPQATTESVPTTPTSSPVDVGMQALIVSRLGGDPETGCLWLEDGEPGNMQRTSVRWGVPGVTVQRDPLGLTDRSQRLLARPGDRLRMAGGAGDPLTTPTQAHCRVSDNVVVINEIIEVIPGGDP